MSTGASWTHRWALLRRARGSVHPVATQTRSSVWQNSPRDRRRRGLPGRPRRTRDGDRPTRRRCGWGSAASGSSPAWSPSVRAPAGELARERAGDRCSPPRSEAACRGPRRALELPVTFQGPERLGHDWRQTLSRRTAERRPHEAQRLRDMLSVDPGPWSPRRLGATQEPPGKSPAGVTNGSTP
jgi:hypothetical protein